MWKAFNIYTRFFFVNGRIFKVTKTVWQNPRAKVACILINHLGDFLTGGPPFTKKRVKSWPLDYLWNHYDFWTHIYCLVRFKVQTGFAYNYGVPIKQGIVDHLDYHRSDGKVLRISVRPAKLPHEATPTHTPHTNRIFSAIKKMAFRTFR